MNRLNKNIKLLIAIRCLDNGYLFTVFDFRKYRQQILNVIIVCETRNTTTGVYGTPTIVKYWYIPSEQTYDYTIATTIGGCIEIHGKLHREGKPAMIVLSGFNKKSYSYYINGKLHRVDGPADVWYRNDKLYSYHWYKNDKSHRDDGGPADVWLGSDRKITMAEWWINGGFIKKWLQN